MAERGEDVPAQTSNGNNNKINNNNMTNIHKTNHNNSTYI